MIHSCIRVWVKEKYWTCNLLWACCISVHCLWTQRYEHLMRASDLHMTGLKASPDQHEHYQHVVLSFVVHWLATKSFALSKIKVMSIHLTRSFKSDKICPCEYHAGYAYFLLFFVVDLKSISRSSICNRIKHLWVF